MPTARPVSSARAVRFWSRRLNRTNATVTGSSRFAATHRYRRVLANATFCELGEEESVHAVDGARRAHAYGHRRVPKMHDRRENGGAAVRGRKRIRAEDPLEQEPELNERGGVDQQRDESTVDERCRCDPPPLAIRRRRSEARAPSEKRHGIARRTGAEHQADKHDDVQRRDNRCDTDRRCALAERPPERLEIPTAVVSQPSDRDQQPLTRAGTFVDGHHAIGRGGERAEDDDRDHRG